MNNHEDEQLESWQQLFYDLNMKLGNDVWGARLEGDGHGGQRMRVFVNSQSMIDKVSAETNDVLGKHKLVYEVYQQEHYTEKLAEREKKERAKEDAEDRDKAAAASA